VTEQALDAPPLPHHAADLASDLEALGTLTPGTSFADAVHRLLAVVRSQLGMQVAWVSEFVGTDQVLRFVDAAEGASAPAEGTRTPLSGSFCARVLDGRFPTLIPNSRQVPEAALLDVTADLHIGAYVGVPLIGPSGVATGMLCAVSDRAVPTLSERDVVTVRLLAQLLHDMQQRAMSAVNAADERARLRRVMGAVIAGHGRHAVLQPIVDLATGQGVAAEGLSRFDASELGTRAPAQWFDDAGRLGLRGDLELATATSVLDLLDDGLPSVVALSVNLAPTTVLSPQFEALLAGRRLSRVIVEMTEHAPVDDYDQLCDVLRPYREQGLRVAVDDAGAGYSSLKHVLSLQPDLIKVDMALVRRCDRDLARRTLLSALTDFAEATECRLVAEGVETEDELRAVAACGVHLAQGYYLGRPSRRPEWSGFPMP
jgi:EAL domain-containing protein (putative c-di-GMP-specific phosphodiesterase class I)